MPDFLHPYALLLLIPLLAGLAWRAWSPPAAIAVSSTAHFQGSLPRPRRLAWRHLPLGLEFLAAACFVVALARPRTGVEIIPENHAGTDISVVVDFSNSMDFFDPEPGMTKEDTETAARAGKIPSRLTIARARIKEFIERRPHDRIGLSIFGHRSYLSCPPTLDHAFLSQQVDLLTEGLLSTKERGTNIASGLTSGINSLLDNPDTRRTIVLISDGENSIPDELTPLEAAAIAKRKGIVIHTIAVGSDEPVGLKILPPSKCFDTKALEQISSMTEGRFFRVKDNQGFQQVMETLDQLEKNTHVESAVVFMRERFAPWAIAGGLCLLAAVLLRRTLCFDFA